MIDIIRGASEKPVSTETLINFVEDSSIGDGILYTGYPIIGGIEHKSSLDALLITSQNGIIVFDIVEESEVSDRKSIRDELYNVVLQRLIGYKELAAKRGQLKVNISVLTIAPAWDKSFDEETVVNFDEFERFIEDNKQEDLDLQDYKRVLQAIQAITKLKQRPPRRVNKTDSKGAIFNEIEKSISNLDKQQSKAVIETVDGIQRIRGLAGSGKTIVLALKVAYLHSKFPDWKIGVTFYTRSLKNQFTELINKFTIEHKNEEPDWNNIKILQAWGGTNTPGLYYEFCKLNNVEYLDFDAAEKKYGYSASLIDRLSEIAIGQVKDSKEVYDAILVDEAQDFSESFLQLCYKLLKPADINNKYNKRLIYAYDELQKINDANNLRTPTEIFQGITFENAQDKPQQDIILEKCYRNSAPVLVTAHALGFGIYRKDSLVTMFRDKELWRDVGYVVEDGELEFGSQVTLKRDSNSSPDFLTNKISNDELVKFESFKSYESQINAVANEIEKNIVEDELDFKDIIVIHPNPKVAKNALAPLRKLLFDKKIESHLAGVNTSADDFFIQNSITFTSIFRAKGNEAAMIYIIGADYCYGGFQLIKKRNILFTAITRSKGWIRVYGVGDEMNELKNEFLRVKQQNFKLKFTYPTIEEMNTLNVLHRDLSESEKRHISQTKRDLNSLINKLEKGQIRKEDIPTSDLEKLLSIIKNDK